MRTGFKGTNTLPYRAEAWEFILAGGGALQQSGLLNSWLAMRAATLSIPQNSPAVAMLHFASRWPYCAILSTV